MGDGDELGDLGSGQTVFRQHAEMVKVHQSGDHDLDKIRALGLHGQHQGVEFFFVFVGLADESAIVPGLAQGRERCAVTNTVVRCQFPGPSAYAPAVAAVAQVGIAPGLIGSQGGMDEGILGLRLVSGDGFPPIFAVQNHVHMAIVEHTAPSF